jgi:hypothetical protein
MAIGDKIVKEEEDFIEEEKRLKDKDDEVSWNK